MGSDRWGAAELFEKNLRDPAIQLRRQWRIAMVETYPGPLTDMRQFGVGKLQVDQKDRFLQTPAILVPGVGQIRAAATVAERRAG